MDEGDEKAVLAANDAFYAAFDAEDAAAMDLLWAEAAPCACVHPGWDPVIGRDEVLATWHGVLGGGRAPRVRLESARALVYGEVALVVCVERLSERRGPGAALLSATNVFVRERGAWRISHHHAGPMSGERESSPSVPPSRLN